MCVREGLSDMCRTGIVLHEGRCEMEGVTVYQVGELTGKILKTFIAAEAFLSCSCFCKLLNDEVILKLLAASD